MPSGCACIPITFSQSSSCGVIAFHPFLVQSLQDIRLTYTFSISYYILFDNSNTVVFDMARKFKIPNIPSTTSKTVRFPNDMIEEVEAAVRGTNCTFSAFVIEAVRVALDNLKEDAETDGDASQ